jgi:uncharacterized LabA/DUF88 family protein
MRKNPFQRVDVFVDVQNMYYSAKNLYRAKVNFARILNDATANRQLIRAVAYVVRAEEPLEQTFFDALEKAGFEVKVKDIQISGDGDYVPAVEFLRNQGHRVEVIAFGPSTSNKLKAAVDEFIDLDENHQKYLLTTKPARKP